MRRLYESGHRAGIGADLLGAVERILAALDVAAMPAALDMPRLRLHPLKGDLAGYWAVTVRANRRIVFRFEDGDVYDVDLVDDH